MCHMSQPAYGGRSSPHAAHGHSPHAQPTHTLPTARTTVSLCCVCVASPALCVCACVPPLSSALCGCLRISGSHARYDSWLSIGPTEGNPSGMGLGSVGINFDRLGRQELHLNDSAVFWMNPTLGPRGRSGSGAGAAGGVPVVVAQITLPSDTEWRVVMSAQVRPYCRHTHVVSVPYRPSHRRQLSQPLL